MNRKQKMKRELVVTTKIIQEALDLFKYLDQLEEIQRRKKGVRKFVRKKR